jgi:hypothetical protein
MKHFHAACHSGNLDDGLGHGTLFVVIYKLIVRDDDANIQ